MNEEQETPQFKHVCDKCTFLGRYQGSDLYCCFFENHNVYTARFSDEVQDFISCTDDCRVPSNAVRQAKLRAVMKGKLEFIDVEPA